MRYIFLLQISLIIFTAITKLKENIGVLTVYESDQTN